MNNYEKIELYLKHGLHVSVKDADGEYLIISPIKDNGGAYRTSDWCATLALAKLKIGSCSSFVNLGERSKDFTEITPFHLDFEPYPVGMKVRTISGFITEIKEVESGSIYTLKKLEYKYAHTQLFPYFEKKVVIEMTVEQIEEKLNITGLKIIK